MVPWYIQQQQLTDLNWIISLNIIILYIIKNPYLLHFDLFGNNAECLLHNLKHFHCTINMDHLIMLSIFFHEKCGFPVRCTCPTCWERERGIVGVAPPREKVKLWEALSVACGLVSWWLTPPIRSKSSAEGGTGAGLEAVGDCTPPNRSVTGWEGPEPDEVGGLAEKVFQSPNSPFPLDEGAADTRDQ